MHYLMSRNSKKLPNSFPHPLPLIYSRRPNLILTCLNSVIITCLNSVRLCRPDKWLSMPNTKPPRKALVLLAFSNWYTPSSIFQPIPFTFWFLFYWMFVTFSCNLGFLLCRLKISLFSSLMILLQTTSSMWISDL
jgi:hypothetical protein